MSVVLPPDKQALKVRTKELWQAAGGVEAAASYTRVGRSQLSDASNRNLPCFLSVDALVDLEDVTRDTPGWPVMTRHLAQRQGFILMPVPELPSSAAAMHDVIGAVLTQTGEAVATLGRIYADGRVDRDEVDVGVKEIDEAVAELMKARAMIIAHGPQLLGEK